MTTENNETPNILLAVTDYRQIKGFYPDDLPAEWYLDFYFNEFDVLYLSDEVLQKTNKNELEEVINERDEALALILDNITLSGKVFSQALLLPLQQGFDSGNTFFIDSLQKTDLKTLAKKLPKAVEQCTEPYFIVLVSSPCEYKHIKEIETLLNLLF